MTKLLGACTCSLVPRVDHILQMRVDHSNIPVLCWGAEIKPPASPTTSPDPLPVLYMSQDAMTKLLGACTCGLVSCVVHMVQMRLDHSNIPALCRGPEIQPPASTQTSIMCLFTIADETPASSCARPYWVPDVQTTYLCHQECRVTCVSKMFSFRCWAVLDASWHDHDVLTTTTFPGSKSAATGHHVLSRQSLSSMIAMLLHADGQ